MTPTPYALKGYQQDGRFHGTLNYGADVVNDTLGTDGFKSAKDLDAWARSAAQSHKASISPKETYSFEHSFVL